MSLLLVGKHDDIGHWVCRHFNGHFISEGSQVIGVLDTETGNLVAGAVFSEINGTSAVVSMSITDSRATRKLLRAIGSYAFDQLALRMLILPTMSTNLAAIEMHKRFGAIPAATLKGAGKDGNDIHISLLHADCRIWRMLNGQSRRPVEP